MAGDGTVGKKPATLEQLRATLYTQFKGVAREDKDVSDAEKAALGFILSMSEEDVRKYIDDKTGDMKVSITDYHDIMNAAAEKSTSGKVDTFEKIENDANNAFAQKVISQDASIDPNAVQNAVDVSASSGTLHDMAVATEKSGGTRGVGKTGEVKADGVKEEKAWYEKAWDFVKENPVKVGVGVAAIAGAAALAFVPGAQGFAAGLFGGGSKLLTAALVVGGAVSFASCGKDTLTSDEPKTIINQTVNIYISGNEDMATLLNYIATIEADLRDANEALKAELIKTREEVVKAIMDLIAANKTNAEEIAELCRGNNALLEVVIGLLIEQNDTLKDNQELIKEFRKQNGNDNKAILNAIIALQNSVDNLTKTVDALANTVGEGFDALKKQLGDILNAIKKGNATSAQIKNMIGVLIAQMQQVIANGDRNNKDNKRIIELLEANNDFLATLSAQLSAQFEAGQITAMEAFMQLMEVLNQIKTNTDEIKNSIIDGFGRANDTLDEIRKIQTRIEGKLGKIDENLKENTAINRDSNEVLKAILDAINKIKGNLDKLSDNQQKYFEKLLDAIAADTAVNSGNGEKLDAILAMLGTINKNVVEGNEAQQKAADLILAQLAELDFDVVAGMDAVLQAVLENGAQTNERMSAVLNLLKGIRDAQQFGNNQRAVVIDMGNQIMALLGTLGFTVSGQLDAILNSVNDGKAKLDDVVALLKALNENVQNNGQQAHADAIEILGMFESIGSGMAALLAQAVANGQKLDDIKGILNEIKSLVANMSETQKDFFNQMLGHAAAHGTKLDELVAIAKVIRNNTGTTNDKLDEVLAFLAKLDTRIADGTDKIVAAVAAGTLAVNDATAMIISLGKVIEKNGETADANAKAILEKLDKMHFTMADGFSALFAQAEKGNVTLEAILAMLGKIEGHVANLDANHKAYFEKLLAAVVKNGVTAENNGKKLDYIASLIKAVDGNVTKYGDLTNLKLDKVIELLEKVVVAQSKSIKIQEDILAKLATLGADMADEFNAILEAINNNGKIGEGIATLLNAVLKKMDNMNETNKQGFKDVIAAIKDLTDAINNLNIPGGKNYEGYLKEIIAKLGAGNVSMGDLLAEVQDLKKLIIDINNNVVKGNDTKEKILEAIEKLGVQFSFHVDRIINAFKDGNDAMLAKLDKILAKLEVLDDNQKKILQAIKDHDVQITVDVTGHVECKCQCQGHNPNEGIIGDLENLLNG